MNFKKLLLLLALGAGAPSAGAQYLDQDGDVELLPHNIYASRNARTDAKGKACGMLMVHCTAEGLRFEGPVVGEVMSEAGVYYVYLSPKAKKLEAIGTQGERTELNLPKIEPKATYEVTLYATTSRGKLTCQTEPSGATVTLVSGGERIEVGRTPQRGTVAIMPGIYSVELTKKGFETVTFSSVDIRPNKTVNLGTIKLKHL